MKKKLLTILLSVFMIMTSFTTNVFADGDVAKIGEQEYATLEAAIAAVNNGETITILQDITYGTQITIDNGKTFNIDFNDGSTSHTFTWDVTEGQAYQQDIIVIESNSNVTVSNMQFLIDGTEEQGNRIFNVNSTGTLKLSNMILNNDNSAKNTPVRNNGGTVVIDGGSITTNDSTNNSIPVTERHNPIVQNLGGTTTFMGNGTYTMQNANTGVAWIGRVITLSDQSTDADRDSECGTVIIENGTFNDGHIVDVNGKGTITINNATFTSGNGPIIKTYHGGIKSNITINNITTSSMAFAQVLEELNTKINFVDGNVKYTPTRFCINQSGAQMTSVSIKNGKFGPKSGDTDIHDEITGLLAPESALTSLTSDSDGYTYQAVPAVCRIDTTGYLTLDAALIAATDGQTITLLDDITYNDDAPNFTINGKSITIDFDTHTLTVNTGMGIPTVTNIFTITNSGNLTVKNGTTVLSGMYGSGMLEPFTISGANSKLILVDITQASNLGHFLTMNGGTTTIDGGTFGTNNDSFGVFLSNNATLNLKNNPIFNFQGSVFVFGNEITDSDTLAGSITIESGTFNSSNNGSQVLSLKGKTNVTINGGIYTATGNNSNSSLMYVDTYGYKSNVTINDFTSNTGHVFRSSGNTNIGQFAPTINAGHYKYNKGKLATDDNNALKANVSTTSGYFGPIDSSTPVADDAALAEVNAICASGYHVEELTSGEKYDQGYRYQIVENTPTPTPEPDDEDSTPRYQVPNTGIEDINNHSLLKLSSLSILGIGTYMVIKKKEDNK